MVTNDELVFLKLGGSLITHKAQPYTARPQVLRRLAEEVRQALKNRPSLRLLIGHGSGSFGHQAAAPYGTREGVKTPREWRGFAQVAVAASRLTRLVTDALDDAGVPVLPLAPSASALCHDGALTRLQAQPIQEALRHNLVPLIHGDVALDEVRGGTIVSTEELFVYLARNLHPNRILLAGSAPGVLNEEGTVVQMITPKTFTTTREFLGGAQATDVTGGMAKKVALMVDLVSQQRDIVAHILSGLEPKLILDALEDPALPTGTRIASDDA